MTQLHPWLNNSCYTKPLAPACKHCADGSKMVILITGLCKASCYYCPLSNKKSGKDLIYADEWQLKDEDDIDVLIEESRLINATGAGITGGDPLHVWKRTKRYISLLKETFGPDYHIHLYTAGVENTDTIDELIEAGLDEIRFHPPPHQWDKIGQTPLANVIQHLKEHYTIEVAFEVPSIPETKESLKALITWAEEHHVDWINLNELEFSEHNEDALYKTGFRPKDDLSAAVKGSEELAVELIEELSKKNLRVGLHYCSVSFKDGIQLKERLKRRAYNVATEYQIITDEGTLLFGIIETTDPQTLYQHLITTYDIDSDLLCLNTEHNRVEIAGWILEDILEELSTHGHQCFLIETYPTADHLEVERIPLPDDD